MSLAPEEEKRIKELLDECKGYVCRRGTVIRKNALGRNECMVIEIKNELPGGLLMALVDTTVDREKNTLSGIRIFTNAFRARQYKKYVFSLDDYRQKWRAWDGAPAIGRPWRGTK